MKRRHQYSKRKKTSDKLKLSTPNPALEKTVRETLQNGETNLGNLTCGYCHTDLGEVIRRLPNDSLLYHTTCAKTYQRDKRKRQQVIEKARLLEEKNCQKSKEETRKSIVTLCYDLYGLVEKKMVIDGERIPQSYSLDLSHYLEPGVSLFVRSNNGNHSLKLSNNHPSEDFYHLPEIEKNALRLKYLIPAIAFATIAPAIYFTFSKIMEMGLEEYKAITSSHPDMGKVLVSSLAIIFGGIALVGSPFTILETYKEVYSTEEPILRIPKDAKETEIFKHLANTKQGLLDDLEALNS